MFRSKYSFFTMDCKCSFYCIDPLIHSDPFNQPSFPSRDAPGVSSVDPGSVGAVSAVQNHLQAKGCQRMPKVKCAFTSLAMPSATLGQSPGTQCPGTAKQFTFFEQPFLYVSVFCTHGNGDVPELSTASLICCANSDLLVPFKRSDLIVVWRSQPHPSS